MTAQYWTRAEREAFNWELTPWEAVAHDGGDDFTITPDQMRRILATVDALEKALRDLCSYNDTRHMGSEDRARALLAALDGKP